MRFHVILLLASIAFTCQAQATCTISLHNKSAKSLAVMIRDVSTNDKLMATEVKLAPGVREQIDLSSSCGKQLNITFKTSTWSDDVVTDPIESTGGMFTYVVP